MGLIQRCAKRILKRTFVMPVMSFPVFSGLSFYKFMSLAIAKFVIDFLCTTHYTYYFFF